LRGNKGAAAQGLQARHARLFARRPPSPQQVLATAGIKGSSRDWEQLLTPLSWKLYQQQRDAARQRQQQQQQLLVGQCGMCRAEAGSSSSHINTVVPSSPFSNTTPDVLAPASISSSSVAGSSTDARAARFATRLAGPHRRSFELPGASAGTHMSAVFGANKQHVARMLREAGSIDPRGLYRMLSKGQGSLAVATSLAGALPGCVSEKLVQFVDVSSSLAGAGAAGFDDAAATGSRLQIAAVPGSIQLMPSSRRTSVIADGVPQVGGSTVTNSVSNSCGSIEGEVCAVCADQVPSVALAGCGHALCCDCTRTIVGEGVGSRPPLCPFCRRAITGFAVVVPALVL
jgi:hypothetical protein